MKRRKRLNSVLGLFVCFALLSTSIIFSQGYVGAASDFKTEIDEAYNWLCEQKVSSGNAFAGLVDSFEDYWSDGSQVAKEYTYDQAVAAIAFLLAGDTASAKGVLDVLKATQDNEGFWINSYWWNNGAGEEIRKHVGPVMWVCLAVMNYEKITGDTVTYHQMAIEAIDWCLRFQQPNGALSGGETTWDSGDGSWTNEVWSSTEQNIDAYASLVYFADTTPSKASVYTAAASKVKGFLDNVVWDNSKNRWYGGYKNNTNTIDYSVPMDVNPWGVLALGANGTHNYKDSISYVENADGNPGTLSNPRYKNTLPYGNTTITAYDFDWQNSGATAPDNIGGGILGADIWFEGSAFMSCAYSMLGNETKADYILTELAKKQGKDGSKKGGLPYCLKGTNNGYWLMAQQNCVSSTGWFIIAASKWNPFTGESTKGSSPTSCPSSTKTPVPTVSPSGGGIAVGYKVGDFSALLDYSDSKLLVTLIPTVSTATTTNIWYTNVFNPNALNQAVAGYSIGSKNSSGNYIVNIPNPSIVADGTVYLFLATNSGDTGWVKCNVYESPVATPTLTPTLTPTPTQTHELTPEIPSSTVMYGDVSNDGKVNSIDYALMRSYLLGIIKDFACENDLLVSDLNNDGKFNSIDFAYMRSYLLGIINVFPVETK